MNNVLRILLLDDNPDDRMLVIRELSREFPDVQVEQIGEAQNLDHVLEKSRFDLVITDYRLHWTDGLAILRSVKARYPDCPVIMFTGTGNEEIAVEAMKGGLDDYIIKSPRHFIRLSASVKLALENARQCLALRKAEEDLRLSEEKFAILFRSSPDAILLTTIPEGRIIEANDSIYRVSGYMPEEVIGRTNSEIGWWSDSAERDRYVEMLQKQGKVVGMEAPFRAKSGEIRIGQISGELVDILGSKYILSVFRDITERKQMEEALQHAAQQWQTTFNTISDAICLVDGEGMILRCNSAMERLVSKPSEEIVGHLCWEVVHGISVPIEGCPVVRAKTSHKRETLKLQKGERWFEIVAGPVFADDGRVTGIVHIMIDITEPKRAEGLLRKSEVFNRSLVEHLPQLIFVKDRNSVYLSCNAKYAHSLGIKPEEIAGKDDFAFYPRELAERYRADDLTVINTGKSTDIEEKYHVAGEEGWVHTIKVPYRDEHGNIVGVLGIFEDITERKQIEEERRQNAQKLVKAMESTIEAMATTVEMRDPYTAGHQRRVAALVSAIAKEMGISEDQVYGISMAGIVHDIGKISVPAEILSRPGKLSKIELDLIRTHPQVGYNILKDIQFPWPIANAILQHHERMDGSGYPAGLSEEAILLEARILAVADVVEAMASHRPYRAAIGLDGALEEISRNSGILYYADVVDACIRLFKEKGLKFE
jgi:PAS domain S-box-containing protein/putative nucleotidyltransferase with HDIG domain